MKITLLLFLAANALAAPAASPCNDLVLPWGVYPGVLNSANTICQYFDVRFGSAPVGKLRFAAPQYPPATVNNAASPAPGPHMSCIQMDGTKCLLGGPVGGSTKTCFPDRYGTQNEDCLFLDIYVPQNVPITAPLPVIVWIYGGGYMSGSKNQFDPSIIPFYSGDGPVDAASTFSKHTTSAIFVAGNYRLGAYGWLAGIYMEENAQPNAGLLDQNSVFQFVQDHISKVNGDPNNVSIWGESAGASSIMHHLVMPKNLKNPPFKKAILQSPAYQWMWDRTGDLNNTFTKFATQVAAQANCQVADINCLQSASSDVIMQVNQNFASEVACVGILPFGPAVDGKLVPDLAPVLFKTGNVAPLDNILVSHVDLEIPYAAANSDFSFIPLPIRRNPQNETIFENFLAEVFTGTAYESIRQSILTKYPQNQFSDQIARAASVIADVSFTCHTRFIINKYLSQKTPVYALDYAVGMKVAGAVYNASFHGTDLLPLFSTLSVSYTSLIKCLKPNLGFVADAIDKAIRKVVSPVMQQYFTNLAISGNINSGNPTQTTWNQAYISGCTGESDPNTCVWNLMVPSVHVFPKNYWTNSTGPDIGTASATCAFWDNVAQQISKINSKTIGTGHGSGDAEQEVLNWDL